MKTNVFPKSTASMPNLSHTAIPNDLLILCETLKANADSDYR